MRIITVLSFVLLCVFEITALFPMPDNDDVEDLCRRGNITQSKECTGQTDGILLCYNHIPEDPMGYTSVVVAACTVINADINENDFVNANWSAVQRFSYIKTELVNFGFNIGPFAFHRMENLRSLHIHNLKGQTEFNITSFCGLDKLKEMNLTGSFYLVDEDILNIFSSNCSLPNIQSISLAKTQMKDILLNRTFTMLLLRRPLKVLDFRSLQLRFDIQTLAEYGDTIEEIYLQNSVLADAGHSKHLKQTVFPNLRILNLSGTNAIFSKIACVSSRFKLKNKDHNPDLETFQHLQILVWDSICPNTDLSKPKDVYVDNVTLYFDLDLKHLLVRDNNVNSISGSFSWPGNKIELLDLSNNKISYLGPNVISAFKKLQLLVLNGNELYNMCKSHSDDFEMLFQSLPFLASLELSRNKLAVIPRNTFVNNSQLRKLDLSFNQLTIINFTMTNMKRLELLDLVGNNIKYSDATTQFILMVFLRMYNATETHVIRTTGILTCSKCNDLDGIQWLVTNQAIFKGFGNISCTLESGTHSALTTDVLDTIQAICYRPTRIVLGVVVPTAALLILLLVVGVKMRRNRKKRLRLNEERNINRWKNWRHGEDTYEFAVFLSFASEDKALAKHIFDKLNGCLQKKIGTKREMVYFSDLHMLSGPIIKGITNAVNRSTSIMFVIADAKAFSDSYWCEREFETAMKKNRPIFIIATDDLNLDLFPLYFKTTFENTSRIVLKRILSRDIVIYQREHNETKLVNSGEHTEPDDGDDICLVNAVKRNESMPLAKLSGACKTHRNGDGDDDMCLLAEETDAYESDTAFEVEGNRYELQTTWENVCAAIVQIQ